MKLNKIIQSGIMITGLAYLTGCSTETPEIITNSNYNHIIEFSHWH